VFVGPEMMAAVELVGLAERGLWPVAGGALDQGRWFIELSRRVWADEARWRARMEESC
jgi:hypothetical protein